VDGEGGGEVDGGVCADLMRTVRDGTELENSAD
jgi:hypothetical protein